VIVIIPLEVNDIKLMKHISLLYICFN